MQAALRAAARGERKWIRTTTSKMTHLHGNASCQWSGVPTAPKTGYFPCPSGHADSSKKRYERSTSDSLPFLRLSALGNGHSSVMRCARSQRRPQA